MVCGEGDRGLMAEDDPQGTTLSIQPPVLPIASPTATMAALSGIERFTLIKKLGEGGMGSVYAAYDSVLDRKVAVKVVRADRRRTTDPVSPRDQLLREAQAMARLSHPNVVTVHEVGDLGDDIYVVLELVDGATLSGWIRERVRPWREIVAAFIQAGEGLAAAHAAGLVHRDFKPNNVLIRGDGRIQVTDFGVVSMSGEATPRVGAAEPTASEITFVGRRVGTPAYMAPEQHAGAPVDGRADQFSFCVALWEALYGVRPFAGTRDTLAAAMRDGQIEPPPVGAAVPRWLEAPLRRGLSPRAADRWPAMADLLAVLARDPARIRKRRLVIAGVTVAIVASASAALVGWMREPAAEPCAEAPAELARHWDADRARALRTAFAASTAPYAPTAATRVIGQLDAWAPRWIAMRTAACRETRVIGEQSEVLLDARMRCLDRQLDEVAQVVTQLATSDRTMIARAAEQLGLPDVATCADRELVLARVPPPGTPATRARVERVEHELAGLAAAELTGRYHDARLRAASVAQQTTEIGFAALAAEALLMRARLEDQDGDLAAARATLAEAAHLAGAAHDDLTLARVLLALMGVLTARAETQAALALDIAADAAIARAGASTLQAALAEQLGNAHEAAGDAEAEPQLRRALALRETADGPDSIAAAQVVNKLANIDARHGRTAEARAGYERALRIATAQLGPDHPATAVTQANLCALDAGAGKLDEARACSETVLATLERALGHAHPQVAWAINELGLVLRDLHDLAGAERRFREALAIWETASGPNHPDVAWPLINLGELANLRGAHAAGRASCQRALAILESTSGATHPDTVPALRCLGQALAPRDATTVLRRALATLRDHGGAPDDITATQAELARALAH